MFPLPTPWSPPEEGKDGFVCILALLRGGLKPFHQIPPLLKWGIFSHSSPPEEGKIATLSTWLTLPHPLVPSRGGED